MADVFSKEKRSDIMSRVKHTDTKIETVVRKYLFSRGLRYRKNDRRYLGQPDIVLPKYKTIVFVHGCFWHMHECKSFSPPKSNIEFWTAKFERNRKRDAEYEKILREEGWNVITVWGCELKKDKRQERLERLYNEIISS